MKNALVTGASSGIGLADDNVKQAIDYVQPFGLDLCGSVRTSGQLDEKKLAEFFEAIG